MKFLIDAQLPARIAEFLNRAGHDACTRSGCPMGTGRPTARSRSTRTPRTASSSQRIRTSATATCSGSRRGSYSSSQTGNTTNDALLSLFELHLDAIVSALGEADFVELTQSALALRQRRDDAPANAERDRNRPSDRDGRQDRAPLTPACRNRPRSRTAGLPTPPTHPRPGGRRVGWRCCPERELVPRLSPVARVVAIADLGKPLRRQQFDSSGDRI